MDKRVKVLISLGILVLLAVGFYIVSYAITKYTGYSITGKAVYSKQERVEIAKCLSEKGVVLYCSSLSLNCMRQKNEIEDIFEYIGYLDCGEKPEECIDLSLPAWKINNRFFYGIRDLGKLAESTDCSVN